MTRPSYHILIIILLLTSAFPQILQAEDLSNKLNLLSKKFVSFLSSGNFEKASSLFHYPQSYSEEELNREIISIKTSLKKYTLFIGKPTVIDSFKYNDKIIAIGVTGADFDYWQKKVEKSPQLILPVEFSKLGIGFLRIEFCHINESWEIKSVDFGIPATKINDQSIQSLREDKNSVFL